MLDISARVLPARQRRDITEVTDQLYLRRGDRQAKQSAFWTMLTISALIATAGVLADSTATVIGAMIIAPMSTPIMGMAIAIVEGSGRQLALSAVFVVSGILLVVAVGALASLFLPDVVDLANNSQVAGRTSPSLLDLIAAVATGFAGAVALSRRDVADVLPGVAIAISLVPPLAVVGITLGAGAINLAIGAFVLFLSNVVALVLAGTLIFTAAGYARDAFQRKGFRRRRAYVAIATLFLLVLVPLAANTLAQVLVAVWTNRVQQTTQRWLGESGSVVSVKIEGQQAVINVLAEGGVPPAADLRHDLHGQIPDGTEIKVVVERGTTIDVGRVGA